MRALALALAAVAGLTACGGSSGGQPQTLPPVTTSPAAAVSPTPAPTGKDAPTPEGAAAFAKFFYAQITRAFETKDPSLITAVTLPTCKTCARYVQSVTRLRENNERATGAVFQIKFAQAPGVSGATANVSVIYDAPEAVRYSATGKVIRREPALHAAQEQVVLQRRGASWVVAEVRV